jgi:hypothetical protein
VAKRSPRETLSQWSADGRMLYVSLGGNPFSVFSLDIQSGKRQLWKTFELPDPAGAAIVNCIITRDARSYAYCYFRFLDELYVLSGLK